MDISAALDFKDSQQWRTWLEQNHDKETEAWLVIYKKRSKQTGLHYEEALEEALCFGWIDGKMRSVDDDKFVLRYSPRKAGSAWSKANKEKAEQLIATGRMTEAGLAKVREADESGQWSQAYSSRIKEALPPDLEAALSEDSAARANFHNLAGTYRNMFIRWLNSARTEEVRKRRIAEIVERARLNQKLRYDN